MEVADIDDAAVVTNKPPKSIANTSSQDIAISERLLSKMYKTTLLGVYVGWWLRLYNQMDRPQKSESWIRLPNIAHYFTDD